MGHHHQVPRPGPIDGLTVIAAYGNRTITLPGNGGRWGKNRIECHDGFTISVIAGAGCHSIPRPDMMFLTMPDRPAPLGYPGPYTHFELGYPSQRPQPWPLWRVFSADFDDWTGIYDHVPLAAVRWLLDQHGGFRRFERPPSTKEDR